MLVAEAKEKIQSGVSGNACQWVVEKVVTLYVCVCVTLYTYIYLESHMT